MQNKREMKLLIKLPAWQLILFVFGIPFVPLFVGSLMNVANNNLIIALALPVPMLLFVSIWVSWLWQVGTTLNKKVSPEIRMNVDLFKYGLIYSILWWAVYLAYWTPKFQAMSTQLLQKDWDHQIPIIMRQLNSGTYVAAMIFQLIAMVCMFYAMYFIAKNFIMAEKQEKIAFKDVIGTFFSLWILPVGILLIQPLVNRLYEEENI